MLDIRGIRLPVVLLAFVVGLALLVAFQRVYNFNQVDRPLAQFFEGRGEVRGFQLHAAPDAVQVEVRLGPVKNLHEAYTALDKGTARALKGRPYRLEIKDRRDGRLVEDYYRLHFILQEGLATGRFGQMADAVSRQVKAAGLKDGRVFVDADHLYLQLFRGDRYLYEVMARPAAGQAMPGGAGR